MVKKTSITIFGATGSIGQSTVDLVLRHKERFDVHAVSANHNALELAQIAKKLQAKKAILANEKLLPDLREALTGTEIQACAGEEALCEAATEKTDLIMAAISGAAGLKTTLEAAKRGATILLANKESLVCAGGLLLKTIQKSNGKLLPVDSEHNGVFQLIDGRDLSTLEAVTLTASGGPFRNYTAEQLKAVTVKQALAHPVWAMGSKISIDSATMMNKGLELIEAHHLFNLSAQKLQVLIHPQSTIHALVSFKDGSTLAQMARPDMRVAISSCLFWPERIESGVEALSLVQLKNLTFEDPDEGRFPCLRLARIAMDEGRILPIIMNAANEIAVESFTAEAISFLEIPALVETVMEQVSHSCPDVDVDDLQSILDLDREARLRAQDYVSLKTNMQHRRAAH